jgi:hypothetical protein
MHKTGNLPKRSMAAAFKPNLKAFATSSVSQRQLQQGLGLKQHATQPSSEPPLLDAQDEMLNLVNKV